MISRVSSHRYPWVLCEVQMRHPLWGLTVMWGHWTCEKCSFLQITMASSESVEGNTPVVFKELNAEEEQEVTEIESLCMNCHENVSCFVLEKWPVLLYLSVFLGFNNRLRIILELSALWHNRRSFSKFLEIWTEIILFIFRAQRVWCWPEFHFSKKWSFHHSHVTNVASKTEKFNLVEKFKRRE